MASVTKVMTAVIVLHDHPLGNGSGPTFTMTAADHAAWITAVADGDSNLDVVAGEHLTERQLLEALMIPSAGQHRRLSRPLGRREHPCVRAEDERAWRRQLGLSHTHYADASGLNPGSRSTASTRRCSVPTPWASPA